MPVPRPLVPPVSTCDLPDKSNTASMTILPVPRPSRRRWWAGGQRQMQITSISWVSSWRGVACLTYEDLLHQPRAPKEQRSPPILWYLWSRRYYVMATK
jgi:hypothetical protein